MHPRAPRFHSLVCLSVCLSVLCNAAHHACIHPNPPTPTDPSIHPPTPHTLLLPSEKPSFPYIAQAQSNPLTHRTKIATLNTPSIVHYSSN
ncbi:hypothetical protein B9Z19DRAFT_1091597, partial [Tuber borchii]